MSKPTVEIENLAAFRRDLKAAENGAARQLSAAIRKAGKPIIDEAASLSPYRTGGLSKSYRARTAGAAGKIISTVPYGAGAEYGQRGKWAGFERYGRRGERFATRALETQADEVQRIITEELQELITMNGWAR